MPNTPQPGGFKTGRIVIIGLGLIGGSLACALQKARAAGEVSIKTIVGCNRSLEGLKAAKQSGVIDEFCTDAAEAVKDADIVVLGVPVLSIRPILEQIRSHLKPGAIVSDVGSVKQLVVDDMTELLTNTGVHWVPAHPIAGSEQSGVSAAQSGLFKGRKVILTPSENSEPRAVAQIDAMWRATGAERFHMSVSEHDRVLAATSHLPHLLAFSLVDTLASQERGWDVFKFAAGGFRDFSRIAASDPKMWHDIFLSNREAVIEALDLFSADLTNLRQHLLDEDGESLIEVFKRAKAARDHFAEQFQNTGSDIE
jgi:3-phosphoshikimate 1-carboxyvinyltransferase